MTDIHINYVNYHKTSAIHHHYTGGGKTLIKNVASDFVKSENSRNFAVAKIKASLETD